VEIGWQEAHPAPCGARHALHRTEESAHHANAGILQERVGPAENTAVENHVLEIRARPDRLEQRDRLPRNEATEQNVARANQRRRRGHVELPALWGHPPLRD
jgi:hypothetical protein